MESSYVCCHGDVAVGGRRKGAGEKGSSLSLQRAVQSLLVQQAVLLCAGGSQVQELQTTSRQVISPHSLVNLSGEAVFCIMYVLKGICHDIRAIFRVYIT